jgi:hypothetical protein
MNTRIIVGLVALALLGNGSLARAADAVKDKTAEKTKAEPKARRIPFKGKVASVDKTARTVTLEGKEKSRTFQVTSETRLTKDGKPAVFDDISVGETIGGAYRETAAGKMDAVTVNIGAKPGSSKPAKKK